MIESRCPDPPILIVPSLCSPATPRSKSDEAATSSTLIPSSPIIARCSHYLPSLLVALPDASLSRIRTTHRSTTTSNRAHLLCFVASHPPGCASDRTLVFLLPCLRINFAALYTTCTPRSPEYFLVDMRSLPGKRNPLVAPGTAPSCERATVEDLHRGVVLTRVQTMISSVAEGWARRSSLLNRAK